MRRQVLLYGLLVGILTAAGKGVTADPLICRLAVAGGTR
jgi:hypothetical protein